MGQMLAISCTLRSLHAGCRQETAEQNRQPAGLTHQIHSFHSKDLKVKVILQTIVRKK